MEAFRVHKNIESHWKIECNIMASFSANRILIFFDSCLEKMPQKYPIIISGNNTELFRCFHYPYFGLHNFLPLTGTTFCLPLDFLLRLSNNNKKNLCHPRAWRAASVW